MAEEIRLSKKLHRNRAAAGTSLYVSVYLMTLAVGQDAKEGG